MDVTTITQLVGSLGFPVVACWYLATRMDKQMERNTEQMSLNTEAIKELIGMMRRDENGK